jgi:large subunit GTPase 1
VSGDPRPSTSDEEYITEDSFSSPSTNDDGHDSDGENFDGKLDPDAPDPLELSDPRIKVLSVLELEDLFIKSAPDLSSTFVCSYAH